MCVCVCVCVCVCTICTVYTHFYRVYPQFYTIYLFTWTAIKLQEAHIHCVWFGSF